MSHIAIRDLFFNVSLTKLGFSVPFTILIAKTVFIIFAVYLKIDIKQFEDYTSSHPGITFIEGLIFISPFYLFSSYVYERWLRPKIKIRNWNEDEFIPAIIILFFSSLFFFFISVGARVLFRFVIAP